MCYMKITTVKNPNIWTIQQKKLVTILIQLRVNKIWKKKNVMENISSVICSLLPSIIPLILEFHYSGQHWTWVVSVTYHCISLQEYWKPNCRIFILLRYSFINAAIVLAGITISDLHKYSSSKQVGFSMLLIGLMFRQKFLQSLKLLFPHE